MTEQTRRQIRLERLSPSYWRVTFDHPPLNIFGPETIPQLEEVIRLLERDQGVKVVVFDSAVEGFFLTHYDFLAKLEDSTSSASRADRPAAAARYAGAAEPCPGGVDRVHSRASHRRRKRACSRQRHALREPREGNSVAMGSRRRPGARRRPDGEIAAPDRPRAGAGSVAGRRRHRRRSRGALRLRKSLAARFRARWLRRCAGEGASRRSTSRPSPRRSVWSTLPACLRRGHRAGVGRVHRLRAASRRPGAN